jgi:hypothetical protein
MKSLFLAAAAALLAAGSAQAAVTATTGNDNTGVHNVLANACNLGGYTQSGSNTVAGCLNVDPSAIVLFTGTENLTYSGGQATLDAADGSFGGVAIALADGSGFTKLIFNIDALQDGTATFFGDTGSGEFQIGGAFALDGNGQNFFTIVADSGDVLSSFRISVADEFQSCVGNPRNCPTNPPLINNIADIKQVRIGIVGDDGGPDPVPEPGMLGLLGLGLLGLGVARRRRA